MCSPEQENLLFAAEGRGVLYTPVGRGKGTVPGRMPCVVAINPQICEICEICG